MSHPERAKKHPGLLEPLHKRISTMLPEYLMIQAGARPSGPEWRDLEAHLAHCKECKRELDDLYQLLMPARANPARPPAYPAPNLAFLKTRSIITQPKVLVIQFTQALLQRQRQPDLAGSFRGEHYYSYEHPRDSGSDPRVAIDVSITDKKRKFCHVLVSVVDEHEPFEQEGSTVTLCFGTFAHEKTTDHQGNAFFTNIPFDCIPQLQFTIAPRQVA